MALNATHNYYLESPELLLHYLINTVELLLDLSPFRYSVFSFWSGFQLFHNSVKAILKHGAKVKHHLIFGKPSFATFDDWLEISLLDHSLPHQLSETVSNPNFKQRYYYDWGFLRNPELFQSFLDTLSCLASRDFVLLTTIPNYAYPNTIGTAIMPQPEIPSQLSSQPLSFSVPSLLSMMTQPVPIGVSSITPFHPLDVLQCRPNLQSILEVNSKEEEEDGSEDVPILTPPVEDSHLGIPKFSYSYGSPILSVPDFTQFDDLPRLDPMISSLKGNKTGLSLEIQKSPILSGTSPNYSRTPKSFLESGGYVQPPALGNFPLPQKGQSLKEFLSSLSDASQPELDRENSHFNISEALISAFESMKVKQKWEELQEQRHLERMDAMFGGVRIGRLATGFGSGANSAIRLRRKLPLRRNNPDPSSYTETEESELEFWQQNRHPPPDIKKKPRGVLQFGSDGHSKISTTEATTSGSQSLSSSSEEDVNSSSYSAENVALNLLRNVNLEERNLPEASTLKWLVTDRDCPQALLPLPKNWNSASESESDTLDKSIRLRGTIEWAPPRPQIIFTIHPTPNLQSLMISQRWRCAGCGVKVQQKYANTYRFCHYLGRLFCSGCHSRKTARLPQMIIHRWDFSQYQVSNFSATLLESLRFDPVYNISGINPGLARKGRVAQFRIYRIQLKFLAEYLGNCRSATELYEELNVFPSYYTADPDLFSLEDLIQLRYGSGLPLKAKETVSKGIQHVLACSLCRELGFHCETCRSSEVIFPFQTSRVSRCIKCSACFHLRCFKPGLNQCPKCLRLVFRKQSLDSATDFFAEIPV